MKLYSKEAEIVFEFPLQIQFIDEKAINAGGVSRDSFSAFFDEAYRNLFDGLSSLYPAIHACVDMHAFPRFRSSYFTWISCRWSIPRPYSLSMSSSSSSWPYHNNS